MNLETDMERLKLHKCMCQDYNKKVIPRSFQVGDVVSKKSQAGEVGKLQPPWEGPYQVIKKLTLGAYYLEDKKGKRLKRPWNVFHLRFYHV